MIHVVMNIKKKYLHINVGKVELKIKEEAVAQCEVNSHKTSIETKNNLTKTNFHVSHGLRLLI